jgi:glycosyltransferase involved in cell wall biosynthesis
VVVPVYRNEASLARVVARFESLQTALGVAVEGVFVVDGSPDASAVLLDRLLATASFQSQLLVLSRNFGAFAAIRAGLAASRGEIVAVMAADLQEPEQLYIDFYRALAEGPAHVAVGQRDSRADPRRQALLANVYWSSFRRFVIRDVPKGGVDVFAVRRIVVDQLVRLNESHTSLVGLLYTVGFDRVEITYDRAARDEGRSSWSLRKRVRYLLDSVFAFTDLPIIAITVVGLFGCVGSICVAGAVLLAWAIGSIEVPGYTPLMFAIAILTSLVLFSLGIVGSYVWRTYENSKGRPAWVPMRHTLFSGVPATPARDEPPGLVDPARDA